MKKNSTVKDLMSKNPITLSSDASIVDAAKKMRDEDIGAVLVEDNGKLRGIVTDRDVTIRVIAVGKPADSTKLGDICSGELTTLSPDDDADNAVQLMRKKGIRRIPVQDGGRAVGILSLGDLALERDPNSALGGISAASPNH